MLKEKERDGLGKQKVQGNAMVKGDMTELLFDMANFDFSLKNIEESARKTKEIILKHTGASGCTIMFLDNYGYLWKIGEKTTYPFSLGEGIAGWSAKCKKTVFIRDIQKDKRYKPFYRNKTGSIVCVPVIKDGKALGVLNLTYSKGSLKNFPPDKAILEFLAKKLESVIENVFMYYVAEGEKNELRTRKAIVRTLKTDITLKKKMEAIRNKLVELIKIDSLSICLKNTNEEFLLCYGSNIKKSQIPQTDLIDIYTKTGAKDPAFLDLSEEFDFNFIINKGSGYITMYPIFSMDAITGYFLIEDEMKNTGNFSVLEKRLVELAARKIGEYITETSSSKKMIEEKERWRTIFHNVDDGIVLLSKEGKIIEANIKAREILGKKKSNLSGKDFLSLFEMLSPEIESPTIMSLKNIKNISEPGATGQRELSKKIDDFFSGHKVMRPKEYYIKTKNGKYWILISIKTLIRVSRQEGYAVVHINDITKRKEIEQDKNEFMSMVSHELRTPLSAMKGFLSMTLNEDYGKLSKEQMKSLKRVEESNERMVALVEDILDVSRIELGRFNLRKEPVNLSGITCSIVREFGAQIQEKKLKVKIQGRLADVCLGKHAMEARHRCRDLQIYVLVDRDRLMQILQNLVSNAIKYSFDGGEVDITIRKGKAFAEIAIKDTGVGVAKKDYDKLFRRFSRIHNPLSVQAGGTGLGLYITKKLVLANGGTIDVK
ncbi:PAS domain S-box protein, partial [candidate division WS5 bacterium]